MKNSVTTCNDNCRSVRTGGKFSFSVPVGIAKLPESAPKEQGTLEPAKACNVPSRKPIKAGLQANADSMISSSAHAQKPSNDNVTFSSKKR